MRVLLTGASGFIGQYVLQSLQQHGIESVAVGRTRPKSSGAFIEADLLSISDYKPLLEQAKPTHLLHLAWYAEHGKYWASPLNLRWLEATTRLVEAFGTLGGQHVVMAGTCAEYDWTKGYCQEDGTPLNPATLYGTAKDSTRRLAMALCQVHQIPCAWGRIFLPYGNGETTNRLIPSLIEVLRGRRPPFGVNAHAYRDFLHVSDVAEGFVSLLLTNANGAYNVSSGEPTRLAEIVTTLATLLDADPEPVLAMATQRPDEPNLLVGENLKLKALGWRPILSVAKGLERTLASS